MMFGCGEEYRHRVNHFETLRRIQEDTGGFTAFIPWIFAPENTPLGQESPGSHRFRLSEDAGDQPAVSRQYRPHAIELAHAGNQDLPGGLQFGADDVGSILIEENVVYAAGVRNRTNEEDLRRIISDAGYIPAQRDTLYRSYAWKPLRQAHRDLIELSIPRLLASQIRFRPCFARIVDTAMTCLPRGKHLKKNSVPERVWHRKMGHGQRMGKQSRGKPSRRF